jgi:molybdopterin synthase sulfur carrier subunit
MIRVILPYHLQVLTQVRKEVELRIEGDATLDSVLNALESSYPMLRGTIRDQVTKQRRPFLRFFACGLDLSLTAVDALLPEAVLSSEEPFRIVGALAGG